MGRRVSCIPYAHTHFIADRCFANKVLIPFTQGPLVSAKDVLGQPLTCWPVVGLLQYGVMSVKNAFVKEPARFRPVIRRGGGTYRLGMHEGFIEARQYASAASSWLGIALPSGSGSWTTFIGSPAPESIPGTTTPPPRANSTHL